MVTEAAGRFDLPASLAAAGYTLRPQGEADLPFLRHLNRLLRWDELAPTQWPDEVKCAFLDQQFDFQLRHYLTAYNGAEFYLVEHRGERIGRFYIDRVTRDLILAEISLLPEWRSHGIGTTLLRALQDEVRAGRADRVSLQVLVTNTRARALYERLGFVEPGPPEEFPGLHLDMVWPAPESGDTRQL